MYLAMVYETELYFLPTQNRWAEMFPCIIARTSTTEVISSGINGTRNGALQLVSLLLFISFSNVETFGF